MGTHSHWGREAEKEEEQMPRGTGSGRVRERPKGTEIPGRTHTQNKIRKLQSQKNFQEQPFSVSYFKTRVLGSLQEQLQDLSSPPPAPDSAGCRGPGMSPRLTTFLALALCLSRVLHAQNGVLPRPSIWAEPGPVIPRGQPVTIVCQGPAEFDTFRLEKKGESSYEDVSNSRHETQARFPIAEAGEDTAGLYHCRYHTSVYWSEPSEDLKLEVTGDPQMQEDGRSSPGLSTEHVFILTGVSVALFLCVLLLVLIFLCCRHQKKHRPPGCEGEEQRPQERVSPAVDMLERTPDLATVDRLPEKDGEMRAPTPTAGGPPDVTYAQLDQRILAQRTARATPPRSMEPTADFSTYAALTRR